MEISKAPLLFLAFCSNATKKGQGFIFYRPSSSFSPPNLRLVPSAGSVTSIRSLQFSDRLKNPPVSCLTRTS